jgi:Na+-driven multidrug efflux pump
MTIYDFAFYAVSFLVVPFWLMMILAPKWHITRKALSSVYIVLPFAIPYAVLVLFHFEDILLFLAPTPAKIEELLTRPYSDILAWIHFIPVDFFVGRWIYFDSRRQDFNVYVMVPILTLCFLLPPLGITIYFFYRLVNSKTDVDPVV